jgi:hypothetical protein
MNFPIWKIVSLKSGRWFFPIRHLALGGEAKIRSNSALIPIERIKMPKRGVNWAFLKINCKN